MLAEGWGSSSKVQAVGRERARGYVLDVHTGRHCQTRGAPNRRLNVLGSVSQLTRAADDLESRNTAVKHPDQE